MDTDDLIAEVLAEIDSLGQELETQGRDWCEGALYAYRDVLARLGVESPRVQTLLDEKVWGWAMTPQEVRLHNALFREFGTDVTWRQARDALRERSIGWPEHGKRYGLSDAQRSAILSDPFKQDVVAVLDLRNVGYMTLVVLANELRARS